MPIENRTTTITGVFADSASTTIPVTPVSGVSYRNASLTQAEAESGWKYKNIVDSADVNQVLYEATKMLKILETYGILPWSDLTDYQPGSFCLASNGWIYRALVASGPSTTAIDPTTDDGTNWENYFPIRFVTVDSSQVIGGNKTFTGVFFISNTNGCLELKPTESQNTGGIIDFHYAGADTNYTSRIIEDESGALNFKCSKIKADTGAMNSVTGWGMPNYASAVSISMTSGTAKSFTATSNCLVTILVSGNGTQSYINSTSGGTISRSDVASGVATIVSCQAFVKKGDTVRLYVKGTGDITARWYPLYGA